MLQENILFAQEPRGKQTDEEVVGVQYLPLPHTHTQIYPKEEADCQGPYLSLLCILNFPHDDLKVTDFPQSLTCCCIHV